MAFSQKKPVLPSDPETRARLIERQIDAQEVNDALWRTMTKLALLHMRGYSQFTVKGPHYQTLDYSFIDDDGRYGYSNQDILFETNEIIGLINSADVRPQATRPGTSLRAIRERGAAQVLADSLVSQDTIEQIKPLAAYYLVALGFVGLTTNVEQHPSMGLGAEFEVVHPLELVPFPAIGYNLANLSGVIRRRLVSVEALKEQFGTRKVNNALKSQKVRVFHVDPGETMEVEGHRADGHGHMFPKSLGTFGSAQAPDSTSIRAVEVAEAFINGPRGTLSEVSISSGGHEFAHFDFTQMQVYPPIATARFYENGTFHGAGHFHVRFGAHRAVEELANHWFRNVREADRQSLLVLPAGQYDETTAFDDDPANKLKFLKHMPDDMLENANNPFAIPVPNTGDQPARALDYATQVGRTLNPVPNIAEEKGRLSSASAIQFLDEAGRRGLTNPTQSYARMWSSIYKSTVQQGITALTTEPQMIPVENLTLDLVGVIIGDDNMVAFDENPIPSLERIRFDIRSAQVRSPATRKAEALELVGLGLQDPTSLKMLAAKEGLDFAMWDDDVETAVRSVVRMILVLYGNGEDPSERPLILMPEQLRPDIQLRILTTFMASDAFNEASVRVKNEFAALRREMERLVSGVLPQGVPDLETIVSQRALTQGQGQLQPAQ